MKQLAIVAWLLTITTATSAQHWRAVGNGVHSPAEVQTIFGDSVSDRLLAGGTFMFIYNEEDTVRGVGQAAWNGARWDSLAHRIQPIGGPTSAQQTYWYLRYNGTLYACGGFTFLTTSGVLNSHVAKLNENTMRWEELGCINNDQDGIQTLGTKVPQEDLYATGFYGEICGYPTSCVFRYDGNDFFPWEPFDQIPYRPGNYVGFVFEFRGQMYMTGSFRDPYSEGLVTFMRHNGTDWEYVPGWNTQSPIKNISIRNDTLYVAGAFRRSTGGPGDLIATFDGENWNDMGGGLSLYPSPASGAALDMEWFHGELYVSGAFTRAGGVVVQGMAKWNGQQWCSLPGYFQNDTYETFRITDMTIWRDSLYICGGFATVDGEPVRDVAQWIGGDQVQDCSAPVAIPERADQGGSLVATWSGGGWRIQTPYPANWTVQLFDAAGRYITTSRHFNQLFEVDSEKLASGIYILSATDEHGMRLSIKLPKP